MEVLVFVGLVALVTLIGLAVSSSKNGNQAPPVNSPSSTSTVAIRPSVKEVHTRPQPKDRFDSETAHEVSEKRRMLGGPAHVTDGDTITIQKPK